MTTSDSESPFHEGERELQERVGSREIMEKIGRKVIRDYLPEEHRVLYSRLPFLVLGAVDSRERPWATVVAGAPGFVHSPEPHTLVVDTPLHADDPLRDGFGVGSEVGVLGIELSTRRRNRVTGSVVRSDESGFAIGVAQTFGNCPKYIQTRGLDFVRPTDAVSAEKSDRLSPGQRALIENADTFFIATRSGSSAENPHNGADVSHRGGRPGFVRVDGDRTLTVPDFAGNHHFNTFGNIQLNPLSGLLFLDFENGDLLYLTGKTEIVWDDPEVDAFEGAERLWRFEIAESVLLPGGLPLRGELRGYSPALNKTAVWSERTS
jgi:predicted pyridoxine 5'-phosphate oxidase superfamily flavin-nucleotide-binding protein